MDSDQLRLVLNSLPLISPLADPIARSFYAHLFEIAPSAKKLFTGDMDRQGSMLMTSLSLAVNGLSNIDDVMPSVQALGERHYSYGVKREHFQPALESFIWALGQHLGDQFTPELKEAWTTAFKTLTDAMIETYDAQE